MEIDENKLVEFYNHSKEYIVREDYLALIADLLEKNNYNYMPYSGVSGLFVRAWLKDNGAQLSIEDEDQIVKSNYVSIYIDDKVTHDFFIFEHTYIDIPYKDSIVTILY